MTLACRDYRRGIRISRRHVSLAGTHLTKRACYWRASLEGVHLTGVIRTYLIGMHFTQARIP